MSGLLLDSKSGFSESAAVADSKAEGRGHSELTPAREDEEEDERRRPRTDCCCGDVEMVGELEVLIRSNKDAAVSSSGVYVGEEPGEPFFLFPPAVMGLFGPFGFPVAVAPLTFVEEVARANPEGKVLADPRAAEGRNVPGEGSVRAGGSAPALMADEGGKVADVGGVGR